MKKLFVSLFLAITFASNAQNMIANPDFKDVNICCEMNAKCSPEAWFMITTIQPTSFEATGFFKKKIATLISPTSETPTLWAFLSPLLYVMQAGKEYQIDLSVKIVDIKISHIDLLLTDTLSVNAEASTLFKAENNKLLQGNQRFSQQYTARGNERYLIIGIFSNSDFNYKIIKERRTYPLILEHISITPINHAISSDLDSAKNKIYDENRRHNFTSYCGTENTNIIPTYRYRMIEGERVIETPEIVLKYPTQPTTIDVNSYADPRMQKALQRQQEKKAAEPAIDNVLRNLNFDIDQASLKPLAYKEVNRLLIIMLNNPSKNVLIVGYTDNSGSKEHNMALSIARAKAVTEYLVRKGIDAKRISYEGRGAINPIDNNDTEEGRSNNRRVEFFLKD